MNIIIITSLITFGIIYIANKLYNIYIINYNLKTRMQKIEYLNLLYDYLALFSTIIYKSTLLGVVASDYHYLKELITAKIAKELDGNILLYREELDKKLKKWGLENKVYSKEEIIEKLKGINSKEKESKKLEEKKEFNLPKDLTYDKLMKQMGLFTTEQINQILDSINERNKNESN